MAIRRPEAVRPASISILNYMQKLLGKLYLITYNSSDDKVKKASLAIHYLQQSISFLRSGDISLAVTYLGLAEKVLEDAS